MKPSILERTQQRYNGTESLSEILEISHLILNTVSVNIMLLSSVCHCIDIVKGEYIYHWYTPKPYMVVIHMYKLSYLWWVSVPCQARETTKNLIQILKIKPGLSYCDHIILCRV